MFKYSMIVTMLHLLIKELIKRHPSDATELIKGFTLSFWNGMGCPASTVACFLRQNLGMPLSLELLWIGVVEEVVVDC